MIFLKQHPGRLVKYLCVVAIILLKTLAASAPPATTPPNVLFIMVDDLRDWTGYAETHPQVLTPNLDKLAAEGIVFSTAYCPAPVCGPSRTSILTGKSPANTGVYENGQRWQGELRTAETLTRKFMNSGYHVAGFGKIYHGSGDVENWHEYIYGDYTPLPKNWDNFQALGNLLDIPDSLTGDWKRVSNAIRVMQSNITKPLFLACGLIRPHTPWNVPRAYFERYDEASIELPKVFADDRLDLPDIALKITGRPHHDNYGKSLTWTHQAIVDSGLWRTNIQAYLASITYADTQIGRLLTAWENSPFSENGIIVLMGDHGWHLGEKQHWSKRTLWEVGTRTPLIIKMPGGAPAGTPCTQPVSLLDIYPTLVDVCQLEPKADLDGTSIYPLLKNPDQEWNRPAVTIWGRNNVTVKSRDWRYIRYCDGTEELYDHRTDSNEWYNLLATDPDHYASIVNNLRKWVPDCTAPTAFNKKRLSWFEENEICQ